MKYNFLKIKKDEKKRIKTIWYITYNYIAYVKKHQLCFAVRKGKGCTGVHLFLKKWMTLLKSDSFRGRTGICPGPNEGFTARGPQTLSGFLRTLHFQPGYAPGIRRQISRKPNLIGYNPPLVFMSLTLSYWLIPISQLVFVWEMVRF